MPSDEEEAYRISSLGQSREALHPVLLREWQERHTQPPAAVYHYTSAQGLLGILNGDLHATHADYLNDPQEVGFAIRSLKAFFEARALAFGENDPTRLFYSGLLASLEGVRSNRDLFVASLSRNGDLLSQWQAYADNGRGYGIGFDGPSLKDMYGSPDIIYFRRVIYNPEEQQQALNLVAGRCEEVIKKAYAAWQGPHPERFINDLLFVAGELLEEFLVTFKHKAFAAEDEWRICISSPADPVRSAPRPLADVRVANGRFVPYMPLPLSRGGRPSPLRTITLGPALGDDDERALRFMLRKRSLNAVKVLRSEIRLR